MLRTISLLVCMGFAATGAGSAATIVCPLVILPGPFIAIEPSQQIVSAGQQFSIDVDICNASNVLADFLNVSFTPGFVSATAVLEGNFFSQIGPTTFLPGVIDNAAGTLSGVEDNFVPPLPLMGVSGSGTLITLRLIAHAVGTAQIDLFNSGLRETTGAIIAASEGATVTVVPEPPSVGLVGVTLLIFALLCHRRPARKENHVAGVVER